MEIKHFILEKKNTLKMKIAAISDLHGNLDLKIEKSDVLCICGDILPLKIQSYHKDSKKWLINYFKPWCEEQPVDEIILIGGNHDFLLANHPDEVREIFKDSKIHYLQDESYSIFDKENAKDIVFYGTPWCHQFCNWAFMDYTDEGLEKIFDKIPENLDVLLTHDAPYGVSDICEGDVYWNTHEHIGSHPLADAVSQKKPKLMLHGHLHTTNHNLEILNETDVYNVSILDEEYKIHYEPSYFEI